MGIHSNMWLPTSRYPQAQRDPIHTSSRNYVFVIERINLHWKVCLCIRLILLSNRIKLTRVGICFIYTFEIGFLANFLKLFQVSFLKYLYNTAEEINHLHTKCLFRFYFYHWKRKDWVVILWYTRCYYS